MKKILLITALLALSCACDEAQKDPLDTLAGSVSTFGHYYMSGEWSFDGITLELSSENIPHSYISVQRESDTHIILLCEINTDGIAFWFETGTILLSGKPGDVTFDSPASLTFRETRGDSETVQYTAEASVKGWIKSLRPSTRLSPATYPYDCDITIECEIDGKPLKLHITHMDS